MQSIFLPLILLLLMTSSACQPSAKESSSSTSVTAQSTTAEEAVSPPMEADSFRYNILQPDERHEMPLALTEVSSVSVINEQEVAMVQDERGRIYVYNLKKKEVTHFCDFRPKGDFEGIVTRGDTAYVLRSDGRIYVVNDLRQEIVEEQKIKTFLTEEDDTEGFAYDPETNSLLIACKEPPVIGVKRDKKQRAIYRYDLDLQSLQQTPMLLIDMQQIQKSLQAQARTEAAQSLAANFDPTKKSSFKPSGLAIHPQDNHIYMIASNGKLLVVATREGQILYTRHLPREVFSQPEGIDFTADGSLFISNEGRDGKASLLRFNPRF